ncbi:lasso RiPP family leader peptide-containing protein [Actinomadura harenae]|uniref:Lasso RiPP family leader peptide-containing protein n=1 Tax=Actinomadura harenae TaxID=2483351 RepID=A0A3M2M1R0_9ACTN|nr:lasso RiPP family leader peptide-containing protein [Actinomadura harenae]
MMRYMAPELTRLGNFTKVTLGHPSWGFEWNGHCVYFNCVSG